MLYLSLKRIASLVSVVFVIVLAGCLYLANDRQKLNESYDVDNIRDSSRIKLVETFDAKEDINQLQGKNFLKPDNEKIINTVYQKEDALNEKGFSLKIRYSVAPKKNCKWGTDLKKLDVSCSSLLSFWIKTNTRSIENNLVVCITDSSGLSEQVALGAFLQKEKAPVNWQNIVIEKTNFESINFNSLSKFEIIIQAGEKELNGTIEIDNIAFVGQQNLYFCSLKDNLYGFPETKLEEKKRKKIAKKKGKKALSLIAKDTWKYFENIVDKNTHLPLDSIQVGDNAWIGDYTSPTNIGLYIMACAGAKEMALISEEEAEKRVYNCLVTLENLPQWKGFHYNFYNTTTLEPTSRFVSTVDCGWLAAGLVVGRNAFSQRIHDKASMLLENMNFSELYDSAVGQLRVGYDDEKKELTGYHYGLLNTEARIASLIAIGKNDIPEEHWYKIYRTLPEDWKWQKQKPQGAKQYINGHEVFEGFYVYQKRKVVPSWGGSMFEVLMPTMVIDEKKLAPESFGKNNLIVTEMHIEYARRKKYPIWGLSPCAVAENKFGSYSEFGIKRIGAKGYNDYGVITPHVSFLSLGVKPNEAFNNIQKFLQNFPIYGEYGLYDSVILNDKKVCYKYLALDQGMSFIGLVNYLLDGHIQKLFEKDDITSKIKEILFNEKFNL